MPGLAQTWQRLYDIGVTQKHKTQLDYTTFEAGYQLRISLECDVRVPKDDPVRLLSAIMDRVDYRRINMAYSRMGRSEYPTRLLTKVWIYGYITHGDGPRPLINTNITIGVKRPKGERGEGVEIVYENGREGVGQRCCERTTDR